MNEWLWLCWDEFSLAYENERALSVTRGYSTVWLESKMQYERNSIKFTHSVYFTKGSRNTFSANKKHIRRNVNAHQNAKKKSAQVKKTMIFTLIYDTISFVNPSAFCPLWISINWCVWPFHMQVWIKAQLTFLCHGTQKQKIHWSRDMPVLISKSLWCVI